MPKIFPSLAAALLALGSLAACERSAFNETSAVAARDAAPVYPSRVAEAPPAPPPGGDAVSLEGLSDTAITARVKADLLTDPALTGADVSVNTDRGVVSLTGTVKTQEQAAIASAHAQRHDGVMRIDNHLSTTPQ